MFKYLKLFAKAIGMPQPIERSRYELENNKSQLAEDGGRKVASTLEEPSSSEEESKAEPKKRTSSTKQTLTPAIRVSHGNVCYGCTDPTAHTPADLGIPKEGRQINQFMKTVRELYDFRLECTCGSWGHECTEEEHDCPTECLIHDTAQERR